LNPEQIRKVIMGLINENWSYTPIEFENQSLQGDLTDGWIRINLIWGDSEVGELGENGVGLGLGILWIDIFVPLDTGIKNAFDYWKILSDLFRRKSYEGVNFNEPSPQKGGKDSDSNMYRLIFKIPFEYFI